MNTLFQPYQFKNLSLRNRVVMAPMCQYSAEDGIANDWHFVHYTSRAIGGVGLVIVEMTNIEPDGRITDNCLGLWNDKQQAALKRIVDAVHQHGAKIGIQIAHAGRKATDAKTPVSASDIAHSERYKTPHALTTEETEAMVQKYKDTAARAVAAGFDTIEIHGAHGYLIHQFQSPSINNRDDKYGQDRSLFGVEVVEAVKSVMPDDMPLLFRTSVYEFAEGGYDLDYGIDMCKRYVEAGVDMLHVSAGGEGTPSKSRFTGAYPGYMLNFARAVKEACDVPVIAVGILDDVSTAEYAVSSGASDLAAIGRALLRDPHWVLNQGQAIDKSARSFIPEQYERGYY
ncbi:MAG TPA: NADH:flavin oxidoreductase/NADH oxidase [Aliicoccus persicus]|uniref:NADH:flavin oxidoreductase/NADH oxidase n=1 Tax=Aliicoccus persicus TaxID=930138 RepID=A0A921B4T1_9STAP|nr:NADH:flavin oxidoreductase/NADH oxidase [Aliicoccus persicus]